MTDKKPKDKERDRQTPLPFCTTASVPEQARGYLEDEPCDDGRSGDLERRTNRPEKEGSRVSDKEEICKQIESIYPEIGQCGINVSVDWDGQRKVWAVDLKKDAHELKTYLEPEDADACMEGRQCVSLGLQIAQLKSNIERMPR